jgi:hypothetical protein
VGRLMQPCGRAQITFRKPVLLGTPSPQPSPRGRGGSQGRFPSISALAVSLTDGRRFTLSSGPRGEGRGEGKRDTRNAAGAQKWILCLFSTRKRLNYAPFGGTVEMRHAGRMPAPRRPGTAGIAGRGSGKLPHFVCIGARKVVQGLAWRAELTEPMVMEDLGVG